MNYKSQHFVPQCYMRSFSVNRDRRSIALYNLKNSNFVPGAAIRSQCARNYFYDRTGTLEKIFGAMEGKYSDIARSIESTGACSAEHLAFLRAFAYLQHLRTEAMAKYHDLMINDMADFVFDGDPQGRSWASVDPSSIPADSIETFASTLPYLADLCDVIVVNKTSMPFITSDNPSVIVNRFHTQKQRHKYGGSGLLTSGFMLVMPISPKFVFVSFDRGVYAVSADATGNISACRPRDIAALNALQVIRVSDNLYFHAPEHCKHVEDLFKEYGSRRPGAWHKWNYAVERPDQTSMLFSSYSIVHKPAEMRTGNGLIHLQSVSVNPGVWCSLFSLRPKPRFYDTNSAAGLVRSKKLLQIRRLLAEPSYPVTIPRSMQSES